ncbi:hypothetical protein, partial [Staphylococcus aureus]
LVFFLMIRRPPRSTRVRSSAASDVYKRQFSASTLQYHHMLYAGCLLYTSPSPRDMRRSRMPSSA